MDPPVPGSHHSAPRCPSCVSSPQQVFCSFKGTAIFDSQLHLPMQVSHNRGGRGYFRKQDFEPGRPPDIARRPFPVFPHNAPVQTCALTSPRPSGSGPTRDDCRTTDAGLPNQTASCKPSARPNRNLCELRSRKRADRRAQRFVGRPTKPFSVANEAALKQRWPMLPQLKQRGSIMLPLILNAVYGEFLKAALAGMTRRWARP
jgi:hypothetical protein